tara:strand:- start:104 stop:667 length:564 start_codon:yes stop_codon:yes gene_type:complete
MDFKNVDLNDYCLNLDLHKSMFFIDMLKDTYEFTLKGDEVEIFKKIKSGISEPITRKELIYSIQVEMVEKYEYSTLKNKPFPFRDLSKIEILIATFYRQFNTIDNIHKAIDNIVYLGKYLNEKESTDEEEEEEEGEDEEESTDEEESDEEEFNELGENKKLVLKNALEKECLSARTELFRPAWTPPR